MLIYNTTYQTGIDDARNFVIWLSESYIPEVEKTGILQNPRLTHILSHKEQDSECFSLQWEVEDTAALHRWHTHCDQLGIIVWQDMPSGDRNPEWQNRKYFEGTEKKRSAVSEACYRKEWKEIMDCLYSYPCIGTWVPFNEAWGQFKTPEINSFAFDGLRPGIDMNAFPSQRSYVFGLNVAF